MAKFNSVLYEIMGSRIKKRREELKINQSDLGDSVDIGRSSIANIEKGRQKPPLSVIYKICKALDIEVHFVLPTYIEIEELVKAEDDNSLKIYYEKYNLNENLQREIDSLLNDTDDDN